MSMVRVSVASLGLDEKSQSPYMLLLDEASQYALPIFIGLWEANAIAIALEEVALPRPISLDVMATLIERLGGQVLRVEVTRLEEGVFYALLHVAQDDEVLELDCRPSDAVALALRVDAPIYVAAEVLAEGALSDEERSEAERKRWKEFLEGLSDEDFGNYKT